MANNPELQEGPHSIYLPPSGPTLEVDLASPANLDASEGHKLAICLHPWSWLGGQMSDPVLHYIAGTLMAKNYHLLRYNSRGVGKSTSWPSFKGFSEAEDLKALVGWALDKIGNVKTVVILGYSHGSLIASLHPVLSSITTYHVLLSYPVGPWGWVTSWLTLFNSSAYSKALKDLIKHPESHVLIIYGTRDEFTSQSTYQTWVATLNHPQGKPDVVEVPGATHLWFGSSKRLLSSTLDQYLP